MERLFRTVLARPVAILAIALGITLAFAAAATRVVVDNTASVWLPEGDVELEQQRRFNARFGEDAYVVAATAPADVEDPGTLRRLAAARAALSSLAGVERVDAPLPAGHPVDEASEDLAVIRAALERHPGDLELRALEPLAAAALVARDEDGGPALSTRPLAEVLVGAERLALLVVPRSALAAGARTALVGEIEGALDAAAPELGPWELAGTDVVTRDLDRGSARSLGALFPLVAAVMGAVLVVALRSWRPVVAIALAAAAASVWTIGLLAACGHTLNLILAVTPAILMVVGAAYALHLLARFLHLGPLEEPSRAAREARWLQALRETVPPCLLTALTTAAGFATLGLSRLPPVRDLGLFTAFGVLASFALVFTLVPALLVRSPAVVPHPPRARRFTPERAARVAAWLAARRVPIVAVGVALGALAALGVARLRVESSVLGFFPSDHPLPVSYASIERDLFGLTSVELWLEGERGRVLSEEALAGLAAVEASARREPLLREAPLVSALGGPLARLSPRAQARLLEAWIPERTAGSSLDPAARAYVWANGGRVALRATLPCRTSSSNAVHALVERVRETIAAAELPAGVDLRVAGSAPLLVRGQVLLLETQLRSFAAALAIVSLVLWLAFRSARLLAASLVPNVLPVALVLGWMGLAGIPLDTATVTVAGIALGLVVDDTIHFLYAWRAARRAGLAPREALARTLERVGRPIVTTSVALALGFGAFLAASFRPTYYFGLLIALTGLAALACDLVLLPALLLVTARRGRRGSVAD